MTTFRLLNRTALWTGGLLAMLLLSAQPARAQHLLVDDMDWLAGSTIGPGGALFVTQPGEGRVLRVDPQTGAVTVFASGLPAVPFLPFKAGGAMDLTFVGSTAYVLVTLTDFTIGETSGIYRIDSPTTFTVVADLGSFSSANPPLTPVTPQDSPTGLQYAIENYRGGFLVTDGNHNRVLQVDPRGNISVFRSFGNTVPTGLAVHGNTVYVAMAGPVPHLPADGQVIALNPRSPHAVTVAAGAPLLVDVEFGRGATLFALSQGSFSGGNPADPADPDTGSLLIVNDDGSLTPVVANINRPTSVEFLGNTAYVATLDGQIWRFDDVVNPPFGRAR